MDTGTITVSDAETRLTRIKELNFGPLTIDTETNTITLSNCTIILGEGVQVVDTQFGRSLKRVGGQALERSPLPRS